MAPRGKTPSLIGGGAGASKFVIAAGKRTCKHCKGPIVVDNRCAEVNIPGTMGHRTYCLSCFEKILTKSRQDLDGLGASLRAIS